MRLTLLCLKWDPRMVLLNSPILETTKDVPRSVQIINWAAFGSLIILKDVRKRRCRRLKKTTDW